MLTCETAQQLLSGETYLSAVEHWNESHWRCRQPPLPSPGLSEPSGAVSRACLTMKTHRGWDSEATFFSLTLFLLHLNCLTSIAFLWVVSSNFCSPKPKKSCIWALTCAVWSGVPSFLWMCSAQLPPEPTLSCKENWAGPGFWPDFPSHFFPSNSLQLPSIFFPSHAALIAWRPLFFYVYFALASTSLLCIITVAVDGINILIIDTEQGSFCLSRLFLLSPH